MMMMMVGKSVRVCLSGGGVGAPKATTRCEGRRNKAAAVRCRSTAGGGKSVRFLSFLRKKFTKKREGIFPVSESSAEIIKEVNANKYVDENARVEYSEKQEYIQVKDGEKKLNNFEKTKIKKNPQLLTLGNFKEWAKIPFEELDSKQNAEDIDIRLKWFGLFHRRKQQYGKFMIRLKLPTESSTRSS
jgi:ferredoxin-nitrite reductase